MVVRIAAVVVVLITVVAFIPSGAWATGEVRLGARATGELAAAPAALEVGELAFSETVSGNAVPNDPKIQFDSATDRIWVSFDYRGYSPGERVSFIVRVNGQDYLYGDLDCCGGRDGRYAFSLERRSGRDFPGGAYLVLIYVGDTEVARGGFGVTGTQGLDDDNENRNESNDND